MEVCIVLFDGVRAARRALKVAMARHAGATEWLLDVAVIRRSARGRASMTAAARRRGSALGEADGALAMPANELAAQDAPNGSPVTPHVQPSLDATGNGQPARLEYDIFQMVYLEQLLGLDSSALVLIAAGSACVEMEAMFVAQSARAIRHQVHDDIDATLRLLLEGATARESEAFDY